VEPSHSDDVDEGEGDSAGDRQAAFEAVQRALLTYQCQVCCRVPFPTGVYFVWLSLTDRTVFKRGGGEREGERERETEA